MAYLKSRYIIIICIFCVLIGVIIGIIIQAKIPISIDNKVRYSELLNWVTTVTLGIWVGYILKNRFENDKIVKGYLLEDIKKISVDIYNTRDYCYGFKSKMVYSEEERKEINAKINMIDKKVNIFVSFLEECYKTEHKEIKTTLIDSFNDFNRKITGDGFYDNPVTSSYFDNIMAESAKFESKLRSTTLTIIKKL